jgi:hypothetical protein
MAAPQRLARMVVVEEDRHFLNVLWNAGTPRF